MDKTTCVFVKVDLFLHEYEFEKLRELLCSEQLEMFDSIEGINEHDELEIIHHSVSSKEDKIIFVLNQGHYLFTSIESLKDLLNI